MLGFLPRKAVLDADDRAAVPEFARAWTRLAAGRAELPDAARGELDGAVEELLEEFEEAYEEGSAASPTKAFLTGLSENAAIDDVREAMERRMFAMPYFGTRIGDEDYPRLDPNDDDELGLLVLGEHPEFHAALADPSFDGEVDGVNPRLHLAVDEVVIRQLWTGDPPEVWAAPQRLRDAGLSRWEVIHQIAAVMAERTWHAMADEDVAHDEADYLDALSKLGREARRGRGRRPELRAACCNSRCRCATPSPRSGGGCAFPPRPPSRICTTSSGPPSAGPTATCTCSRPVISGMRHGTPTSTAPGRPTVCRSRRRCRTSARSSVTSTTSVTPGSTTSCSRRCTRTTTCGMPSVSRAGAPARPRTAAASAAGSTCARCSPTRGSIGSARMQPAAVLRVALASGADAVVLAHNHVSASRPSAADAAVTRRLVAAGAVVGVALRGHLVLTPEGWYDCCDPVAGLRLWDSSRAA